MPIITDKELSATARPLWLKAMSAVELRNYGYAIELIQAVLKESPGFLDGRKILRKAEVANTKGKKSLMSGFSTAGMKGAGMVKKDPIAAMELAEQSLKTDPYNRGANDLLKDAAKAAGFPEIAAFALETLVEGNPKDTKIMHELGEQYTAMGEADKAVEIYSKIVEITPADLVAAKRSKDAAAAATMKQGGWETAKSYRDIIKNKDQAVALEQQSRQFKDVETIDAQLAELYPQYEQQPDSIDMVRRIALLWEQKQSQTDTADDLAQTVQWFSYLSDLLKGSDPAIARKLSDMQIKQVDQSIKALEDWFAQGGDQHPDAAQYQEQLEGLKKQKADSLLDEARRRVDRNPTDLQFRYELGECLIKAGQIKDAVPELQKARNNPNVRLKAMNLLGQCFTEMNMMDMAVTQFKTAASEMIAMDGTKKEILYKLGLVYEKMGKKDEYLNCMKEIYEVDYGYRDVAQRVESSYTGGAAA
ncbi:tetratricopeptide repeat protein [Verrucomicrobiota bacterium sgz303538]